MKNGIICHLAKSEFWVEGPAIATKVLRFGEGLASATPKLRADKPKFSDNFQQEAKTRLLPNYD